MTWTKLGAEFWPECLHHGLSDAAARTHAEAIAYLYEVEEMSCTFPKRLVRTFAGSEDAPAGIKVLVALKWWKDRGAAWEVVHHADVIRASLAAQRKQRATSKKTSAKYRAKHSEGEEEVTRHVTGHVTPNADRQTSKHLESGVNTTCKHGFNSDAAIDPWKSEADCPDCQEARKTA